MVPSWSSGEFPIQDGFHQARTIRVLYDGDSTGDDALTLVMVGDQNDAIRGFKISKHSIRRGDLDLGCFWPGRSGSSRSLFSYRFRLLITLFG